MIFMSKPRAAPRHRLADAAEADQAQRLAAHGRAGQMVGLRAGIDAGAEQLVAQRDVARHREQQAEADVGGGVGDDRRNVGDRNAELGRLRKIDAVLRDVHRRHRLELRIGGQHVAVDGVVQQRQQDVAALHRLDQLVLRQHAGWNPD